MPGKNIQNVRIALQFRQRQSTCRNPAAIHDLDGESIRMISFRNPILVAVALAATLVGTRAADARVEAGMLTCEVGEGAALIISSPRDLHCVFHKANGQTEAYRGKLREIGLDIGVSGRGVIAWAVLAATTDVPPGELAGTYGGIEAGAAAAVGGRGQALVGGARRTISLQPLSVEGEAGLNLAVGIVQMELHPLMSGQPASPGVRIPAVGHSYAAAPHASQEPHYGCGSYTHLQRGQTLYGLAHACGVTLEALLDANPQIDNVRKIADGALIHVPSHVGHHADSPCGDRAVLQDGEALDHLAWRCGVTLHALLRANPGVRDLGALEAGLVVVIPERRAAQSEPPIVWARTEADVPPSRRIARDTSQPTDRASKRATRACLDRMRRETGVRDLEVLSSEFSQANSMVMIGVGPSRAPWRCLVSNDGVVAEVSFAGRDGGQAAEARPAQLPETADAKVPGTPFHATGEIACARGSRQPMTRCKFGVVREGNGNGAITVFWPDGGNRVIYFEDLTPMRYDESQADAGARMTVRKDSDGYKIRIGEQRFEIFEAVMSGG